MHNKISKKKMILISILSLSAISAISAGTLALFTDYAEEEVTGSAGVLDINVNNFILTNKDNINPGDNDSSAAKTYIPLNGDPLYDPSNPSMEIEIPTTQHDISFSISNDGNQSARMRSFFYVSCIDSNENILDPTVFHILDNEKELTDKYVIDDAGNQYLVFSNTDTPVDTIPEGTKIVAIKYAFGEELFDGIGKGSQREAESTIVANNGKAEKEYKYKLAMEKERSCNDYQGVSVSIELVVEAIQYRNTTEEKWTEVARNTLTATTSGQHINIVPNASEEENQITAITTSMVTEGGTSDED